MSAEAFASDPWSRLPNDVFPHTPAEPAVDRSPRPGFWGSVLWCLGILLVQIAGVLLGFGAVVTLVAVEGLPADVHEFLKISPHPGLEYLLRTPGFQRLLRVYMVTTLAGAQLLTLLLAWGAVRSVLGADWPRMLALRRPSGLHLVLVLLTLPGVMLLPEGVDACVRQHLPDYLGLDTLMASLRTWPLGLAILIVGVLPGIAEELFFRGFIGHGLVGRYGVLRGVLLTSLLFGLVHLEPRQIIYAPVVGVLLHWIYWTTRSLWMPMLLHVLNNALSVAAPRFDGLDFLNEPGSWRWWAMLSASLLLLAICLWALHRSRTVVCLLTDDRPDWLPSYPNVAHPPVQAGAVLVRAWPGELVLAWVGAGVVVFVTAVGCVVCL
ncbi:MAG: CPBP family intramembrane glutamic endopeptidase [Gemmataceae bacterium]|nr:CPBP family intramembrane glutamic endopeptidase [Gemmataceae bacterium]